QALLDGDADVNARDPKGATALLHALAQERGHPPKPREGYAKVARLLLLAKGVDVNVSNQDGETALIRAAWLGETGLVKQLLAGGANADAVDALDNTALVLAYEQGHAGVVKLLEGSAAQRPPPRVLNAFLRAAVRRKDADKVKELLGAGADPNYTFPVGYSYKAVRDTVLVLAAKGGHAGIVRMLLDKGADVSAKGVSYASESGIKYGTALEAVEFSKHADVIALLRQAAGGKK